MVFQRTYPRYPGSAGLLALTERLGLSTRWTGRGVTIAFIDSGFYPHPDFARRVRVHVQAGSPTLAESRRYRAAGPLNWHGTMSAALAAGSGRASGGRWAGPAPHASLALIAVATRRGQLKEADILRGLRWVLAHGSRFGVRIVNLSVGGDAPSLDPAHPIHAAVRELAGRGVLVVAAAGNRGAGWLAPPASAPEALTVGGIDDRNSPHAPDWALYSHNYGTAYDGTSKPELLAPAAWIASPYLPGTPIAREAARLEALMELAEWDSADTLRRVRLARRDLGLTPAGVRHLTPELRDLIQARIAARKLVDARTQYVDGTSVAAAIVSGVAAQMLEANPLLTPGGVKDMLMSTARPLPGIEAARQVAGVIQPARALELAEAGRP